MWRIDGPAGTSALRVLRDGEHDTASYEAAAMAAARNGGVAVPEVLARGEWSARPVLLLSWCEGRTLAEELRRRPWAAFRLGQRCGRAQAALHDVDAGDGLAPWLDRFGTVDPALATVLADHVAARSLLHLDLHAHNVLVDGDEVSAIVDWTNAAAGDPRADLARSWSLLVLEGLSGRPHKRAVYALVRAGWARGYATERGAPSSVDPFRLWALEVLLAGGDGLAARPTASIRRRSARLRRRLGLG